MISKKLKNKIKYLLMIRSKKDLYLRLLFFVVSITLSVYFLFGCSYIDQKIIAEEAEVIAEVISEEKQVLKKTVKSEIDISEQLLESLLKDIPDDDNTIKAKKASMRTIIISDLKRLEDVC